MPKIGRRGLRIENYELRGAILEGMLFWSMGLLEGEGNGRGSEFE
jgi:hypothetical protein